ncbi:MAG: hybrid sensor histidine kinase/response regulator [Rhodospirillales bacterium]|nr:hybrid sensor histidine kinase/response regulator [Rhodospirillales bacterium]
MLRTDAQPVRDCVLILAPIGRDATASAALLQNAGIAARICDGLAALVAALTDDVASVFVAEEALHGQDTDRLFDWVRLQPPWSDLPFVVLTSRRDNPAVAARREALVVHLRNVSLLERPVQAVTLTSTIRAAIRARARQYEIRTHLLLHEQAAAELEALVQARTRELEQANQKLRNEMAERARAEDALRQAQRIEAVGQLTGGVAHDFNNLLMVIAGGLEMLERQEDQKRRQRLLQGMRMATERGAALTRQLLAFARRQKLRPEPVDLTRQVGGMHDLLDRSLRGDIKVATAFANDLWPVEVDPGELELVLLNLAVNARDAMPRGGTITIHARNMPHHAGAMPDGDFVELSVIDDGTGMSPAVVARAFEPFFTTKEVGKGSGLGLAQVYGFAQQSGGHARIVSEVGSGTAISLMLPRSHKLPAMRSLDDATVGLVGQNSGAHVLLVEDDDEVAALVSEMLLYLGFTVTRAASAAAALGALANERRIDLVFSDIMMPGSMNGVELAREVRKRRPDLPVLLTSGYADASKRAAEAEGIAVLAKPFRLDLLAKATRETLHRH